MFGRDVMRGKKVEKKINDNTRLIYFPKDNIVIISKEDYITKTEKNLMKTDQMYALFENNYKKEEKERVYFRNIVIKKNDNKNKHWFNKQLKSFGIKDLDDILE